MMAKWQKLNVCFAVKIEIGKSKIGWSINYTKVFYGFLTADKSNDFYLNLMDLNASTNI